MRVLAYEAGVSPRAWGRSHGEEFRGMIQELAAIRRELCVTIGGFGSDGAVDAAAERHLPGLEEFDRAIFDEVRGIAEGAAISLSSIIVLNHYTDLRDLAGSDAAPWGEEGCSAVFTRGPTGALLAQTWDMHGSAEPYVLALRVPESGAAPASWCFTITGCVGMTGLNAAGLGLTINNLRSQDARVGVVWPALVRSILKRRRFSEAATALRRAPVGSGHHYLLASEEGALGLETSGTTRAEVFVDDGAGARTFVHTNHCLDEGVGAMSTVAESSTTLDRYEVLQPLESAPPLPARDLWERLGSHERYPRAVCTHLASPQNPHGVKTCGGILMDLAQREAWLAAGCLHRAQPMVVKP